ncbi:MAG: hypothetical protein IH600_15000 [Bacteroidetes bacterium]|nr:hypothetical protein [Bacteroidota bacterium]
MEQEVNNNGRQMATLQAATQQAATQQAALEVYRPQSVGLVRGKVLLDGMAIESLADACWKSGMFKDIRSAFQAIVKIKVGIELGIPPMQAMSGVYIIEGKTCLSATNMAALIKASGKYNYRVQQLDDNGCSIAFYERDDDGKWQSLGPNSTFTMADAQKAGVAGKSVWKSWPRNMLFARALSNAARWYCADIFLGPVYVPEEVGMEVNAEGEPVFDIKPENVRTDHLRTDGSRNDAPRTDGPKLPSNLVRNDWQREAAKTISPRVAPEVIDEIKATATNPLFSEVEFTRYLIGIAKAHVIQLPEGVRPVEALMPEEETPSAIQEPLFDYDGNPTHDGNPKCDGNPTAIVVMGSEDCHE